MLALLRRSGEPIRLLLIGDAFEAADRRLIEERAARAGLTPWLHITGSLPRAQAIARMSEVDIALSPYYPSPMLQSTSPTKLVEYLALGLPVVASEHPEQRAILRASKAGVCTPWGARHFARGARWLMRRRDETLAAMADRGRAWVVNHRTYSVIADRLEGEYRRLTAPDGAHVLRTPDPMG
jgi:glycosyltransferase involved in cell wall biosynthesis